MANVILPEATYQLRLYTPFSYANEVEGLVINATFDEMRELYNSGETVTVVFNGQTYHSQFFYLNGVMGECYGCGNPELANREYDADSAEDTGEPFAFCVADWEGYELYCDPNIEVCTISARLGGEEPEEPEEPERDVWEVIAENGGKDYAIGDYVMLELGTIDGKKCGSVRMCKVAEGEEGTNSTWLALDALERALLINTTDTVEGGWEASELRAWLNGAFFNGLPEAIRKAIVPTTRYTRNWDTSAGELVNNVPTQDYVWIPSTAEVTTLTDRETMCPRYDAFIEHYTGNITQGYEGTAYRWWHRTARSSTRFEGIAAGAFEPGSGAVPTKAGGAVIGFSIKAVPSYDETSFQIGLIMGLLSNGNPSVTPSDTFDVDSFNKGYATGLALK